MRSRVASSCPRRIYLEGDGLQGLVCLRKMVFFWSPWINIGGNSSTRRDIPVAYRKGANKGEIDSGSGKGSHNAGGYGLG